MSNYRVNYKVEWSEDDSEFVGTCDLFPSMSWLGDTKQKALYGIHRAVQEALNDLSSDEKARLFYGYFQGSDSE